MSENFIKYLENTRLLENVLKKPEIKKELKCHI